MKTIPLSNSDQVALVDDEDYEWLMQWHWKLDTNGYAYTSIRIPMHRMILGVEENEVDHRDSISLNNVRSNLRPATTAQNQWNRGKPSDNTSGFKGVSWFAPSNKWVARVQANGKRYHIGYFDDPVEAARAYDRRARELHGEFARTNEDEGNFDA